MSTIAIVVAAGAGVRMGAAIPKALMPLAGRPMIAWSVEALAASGRIDSLVVAAPAGREDEVHAAIGDHAGTVVVTVVPGGSSRADSVRLALDAAAADDGDAVLVHDAARPLLTPALVGAVLDGVPGADGAIAAAPTVDTLKRAGGGGMIDDTVPRAGLWAAQTPQAFPAVTLRAAIAATRSAGGLAQATDCASMVEASGGRVRLVTSDGPNPKVTTPADHVVAEAILAARGRQ